MKKTFLLAAALVVSLFRAEAQNPAGGGDMIRQMLFANQSLKEQAALVKSDSKDARMAAIVEASTLADEGKKKEAIAKLKSVLEMQPVQSRVQLWVWSDLRALGEMPHGKDVNETMGVILEVPVKGAYDILAAYADGTAAYLNYSGLAVSADTPDATLKGLCHDFIASTDTISTRGRPRLDNGLPMSGLQVTLLTRSGNYVISSPPKPVIDAGARIMSELVHRAQEKKKKS